MRKESGNRARQVEPDARSLRDRIAFRVSGGLDKPEILKKEKVLGVEVGLRGKDEKSEEPLNLPTGIFG